MTLPNLADMEHKSSTQALTAPLSILGEPTWFSSWRKKLFEKSASSSFLFTYGLGIKAQYKNPSLELYQVGTVESLTHVKGNVKVDTLTSSVFVESVFKRHEAQLTANDLSMMHASCITSGEVIHAEGECKLSTVRKVTQAVSHLTQIVVKEESHFIFEERLEEGEYLARTVLIDVLSGANFEHVVYLPSNAPQTIISHVSVMVSEGASYQLRVVCEGGTQVKDDVYVALTGEGASGVIGYVAMKSDSQILDVDHRMVHLAPHTRSRIGGAGAASGTSRIIYRGHISIPHGMASSDGAQEGRFMILQKTAKIDAIPALDIGAKDVKCAHKMAIGHISDERIFYPALRGLDSNTASSLIVSGMMKEVLENSGIRKEHAYEMSRIAESLEKQHNPT